jgi:hypothetical protein
MAKFNIRIVEINVNFKIQVVGFVGKNRMFLPTNHTLNRNLLYTNFSNRCSSATLQINVIEPFRQIVC